MSTRLSKRYQEPSTMQFSVVYLTIEDVMERLQVSRPTVYKYFRWGLPRYKVGKSVRVSLADLEKWLSVHQCIAHVQSFYSQKLGEGLSPGTVRNLHLVLHSAMENAVKWNLVSRNVVALVTRPSKGSYEAQVLTVEQARTLIETAKHHKVWPLLVVALSTGMRRGEMLALRWEDVDFQGGKLFVRRAVSKLNGRGYVEHEPKTKKGLSRQNCGTC